MHKKSLISALLGLLAAAGLLLPVMVHAAPPLAAPAAVTSTPTPTPKPKPTVKAAKARSINNLKAELFLGGETAIGSLRLGILVDCPSWDDLAAKVDQDPQLPYVYNAGRVNDMGQLCVYGLDPAGYLEVDLTRSDGSPVDPAYMTAEFLGDDFYQLRQDEPALPHEVGYGSNVDGIPVFSLALWWPAGLPTGTWQVALYTANGEAAYGEFKVKAYNPQPAIGLIKPRAGPFPPSVSPLLRPQGDQDCTQIQAGRPFTVNIVNLPATTDFALGLYFDDGNNAKLIKTYPAVSNKKGNQKIDMQLNDDLETGRYYLLLPTTPTASSFWESGPSTCLELIN